MKKLIASLVALTLVFAVAMTAALAEETAKPALINGVEFNTDMDQIIAKMGQNGYEKDVDHRGGTEYWEVEYEHYVTENGRADLDFLFIDNNLVAIHYDFADGTNYDEVKAQLVKTYGEAVPFDAAKIGNGKFAIDDDGEVYKCQDMILNKDVTIVLEKDHDGDVEVTFLDPTAPVFNG